MMYWAVPAAGGQLDI